jgi:hypothetical protein
LLDPSGTQAADLGKEDFSVTTDENGVQSINHRRGCAGGGFTEEGVRGGFVEAAQDATTAVVPTGENDWAPSITDIGYNKGSKITLDESGKKIANIETIEDGNLITEIYLASGELLYRGPEVGVQNYYNEPENRDPNNEKGITGALFLGDITSQAEQYFEAFQNYEYGLDLLNSGTNNDFDFKGTEWIDQNANSVVILGEHVMTLRDAGNFLFGYSAKEKGYPSLIPAWGGGFDQQNKGDLNKLIWFLPSLFILNPPYFGEEPRSANMSYLGMSLFAPKK